MVNRNGFLDVCVRDDEVDRRRRAHSAPPRATAAVIEEA